MKNNYSLAKLHNILKPALSKAAIGNYDTEIEIDPRNPEMVNDILMGVDVLLDVIREQEEELVRLRAAAAPQGRPTPKLLDEVLRDPLD